VGSGFRCVTSSPDVHRISRVPGSSVTASWSVVDAAPRKGSNWSTSGRDRRPSAYGICGRAHRRGKASAEHRARFIYADRLNNVAGLLERGGLLVWRPYEDLGRQTQQAMLGAAAAAAHLASDSGITARDVARQLLAWLTIGCRILARYEEQRAYPLPTVDRENAATDP
jgi:hypothetical protein